MLSLEHANDPYKQLESLGTRKTYVHRQMLFEKKKNKCIIDQNDKIKNIIQTIPFVNIQKNTISITTGSR